MIAHSEITDSKPRAISTENILLAFIVTIGLGLRLWNITWGLPEMFEEATPLVKAWQMWKWGFPGIDLNPHFFNYPGFTIYLQFIVQAVCYFVGHLLGIYPSLDAFGVELSTILLPARIVTLLFDIGTIIVAYKFGEEYFSPAVGLFTATLVALNPLHIAQAHYVTVDTPLTFFVLFALYSIYRTRNTPTHRWYILTGISIGLATATKYTGALLLPVLLASEFSRAKTIRHFFAGMQSKSFLTSILTTLYTFLIFNPFILLSFSEFRRDFSYEQHHVASGHLGLDASQSTLGYYLADVFPKAIGWILCGVFVLALVMMMIRREKKFVTLLLFPLLYFVMICSWEMRAERYILPIIPILLLIAAAEIHRQWKRLVKRAEQRSLDRKFIAPAAASALCFLVFFQPVQEVIHFQETIALPNTRTVARQWIEQHLSSGSTIAMGAFGIRLEETNYRIVKIPFRVVDTELESPFYDVRWYDEVDLLVASDYDYGRYLLEPERYREILPFYDSLRTRWTLAVEIKPTEGQDGPTFWLYTPPQNRPARFDSSLFSKLQYANDSTRVHNFLNELGLALYRNNHQQKAEQVLRALLSNDQNNLDMRQALAVTLFGEGQYQETLEHVGFLVTRRPNDAAVLDLAGRSFLALERFREAETVLLRALALSRNLTTSYEALAELYGKQNEKARMGEVLRQYLAILPPNSEQSKKVMAQLKELHPR